MVNQIHRDNGEAQLCLVVMMGLVASMALVVMALTRGAKAVIRVAKQK